MNWFTYSSIDNNLKTYNTREVDCLKCEETFKECYYCGSKKLGNERIVINPNI